MQITNIEFTLGNRIETIEDLGKYNPDWIIDKLKDKTGIESRPVLGKDEDEKTFKHIVFNSSWEKIVRLVWEWGT